MYIYLDGKIIKKEDAKISPFDHGYMYGIGLFETLAVYDGHPFLLDDHLSRLNEGLNSLAIDIELHRDEIFSIITRLLNKNNLTNSYVRLNVSAGVGDIGLSVEHYTKPTVIIYIKPLQVPVAEKAGVFLKTKRNTPEGKSRLKSHHFLNNVFGKREIGVDATKEGIFLSQNGFIAEGIVSNVFWVKNDKIYTPSLETGILNGVTRQFVMTLAKHNGLHIDEGLFKLDEILMADEVFVTNSIQELIPIYKIEHRYFQGNKGNVFNTLKKQYDETKKSLWSRGDLQSFWKE
ncbi:aminodeoxychorismate lyase [Cytobacillus sp. IB215665]|uniref:aminodeoxychorismate lyase n=1 Tax=Cytobacillus sp. IB215665 TaxID=3097357 RepID=UPI002A0F4539|nr:aminodeoxychorismate lyase [Cytobacillus sp. IB215665]MDX8367652.1 aminodeoxychorismate lyase [Cytobacillus sp. IB215665]